MKMSSSVSAQKTGLKAPRQKKKPRRRGEDRSSKPAWQREIADERMRILFGLAEEALGKNPERSRRYVSLARKIGMRYNVRMPKSLRAGFCKECNSLLKPGVNCVVRANSRNRAIEMHCLRCKAVRRYPYSISRGRKSPKPKNQPAA